MDDATLDRIFDPYLTTKPVGHGTGMGSAMVHGIVRSAGGSILIESEPGKGTLFQIFLPIESSESESIEFYSAGPMPYGSEHFLVVDDEAKIVYMWKRMLEKPGYCVTARTSSLEALQAFSMPPANFDVPITYRTMATTIREVLRNDAPL